MGEINDGPYRALGESDDCTAGTASANFLCFLLSLSLVFFCGPLLKQTHYICGPTQVRVIGNRNTIQGI